MRKGAFAIAVVLAAAGACQGRSGPHDGPNALLPLEGPNEQVALDVPGHLPSVISVPLGAKQPRPILVALHGPDFPEWQCTAWRQILGAPAFVLCPRGSPVADQGKVERFGFESPVRTSGELRAGLAALKAKYPEHVASAPVVLTGFDLGAEHALTILREEPRFFSRVALISGTALNWSSTLSAIFGRGGGERVLFVCTSRACDDSAARAESFLRIYPVEVRRIFLGEWGIVFDDRIRAVLATEWPWLVEGAAPWRKE